MRKLFALLLPLAFCALAVAQQALTNDSVIKMVKAGLSDDVVIAAVNGSPGQFTTTPDALIALKQAGVSDKVIAAIMKKEAAEPAPASPAETTSPSDTASGSGPIRRGARIVIAPMGGFETYFAAAVREKKVPISLTLDKASAEYFVVSTNTDWRGFVYGAGGGATWNGAGGSAAYAATASSTRGLEASIMVIDARTKDVVWAYEVHKSSHGALLFGTFGARGEQSIAEACAKHLKEYIEKGK